MHRAALEAQINTVMLKTLARQTLTNTKPTKQIDRVLLQQPGPHTRLNVTARPTLQHNALNTLALKQKRKRQTRRTRTYNPNLRTHGWLWTLPPRALRHRVATMQGQHGPAHFHRAIIDGRVVSADLRLLLARHALAAPGSADRDRMAVMPAPNATRAPNRVARRWSADGATKAIWAAFALLGMLFVAYLGISLFRRAWQFSPLLDGWLIIAFQLAACGLCLLSGLRRHRHRRVAFAMGIACLSWTVGDVLFTLASLGGATPPTPSLADGFFYGFYPVALVAVFLFVRREITRGDAANWLDGGIAGFGLGALCSALAYHGIEHVVKGDSLAVVTNLGFPVADLVMLGIVVGSTVFVASPRRAALILIALGAAVNAAGDTINFVQPPSGPSQFSSVLNAVAWPLSILLFALAMWLTDNKSGRFALKHRSGFVLPGLLTASSLAILVVGTWYHVGPIAVCLAAVTLVLAGARLAFRPALRLARQQLRSSEERYRLLFEQNPLPMVTYDRQTLQIVAASDAMVRSYGYSHKELHAMTIGDLLPTGELARPLTDPGALQAGLAAGSGSSVRHQRKDGTIIDVDISSDVVTLDGRECAIALYNDVTERNRLATEAAIAHDRAVEASNMKSAFLANVSHEVRTPMNGVIGMTDLLLHMELSGEQRECAEQVAASGRHMLELINDILDLSKIETGHLTLELANFDLAEVVTKACSAARPLAQAKDLRLDLEIDNDVPRHVRGDGRRLQQVVANLLSNAVKFTAAGAVTVRLSASATSDRMSLIRVAVSDTGIGVEAESLPLMFDAFTQADVSTTRLFGGTGLGLAIAREIVDLMGGTINAESTPGRGSTFWFEVELEAPFAADGLTAPLIERNHATAPSWAGPPLVLVAEDSPVNQIVATRVLERCGCRVEVVQDGAQALAALAAKQYDAVLMDCQMPGIDGYDTTRELRRRENGASHTPVIAMTAHAMTGDRERCLEAGMDDYISKPVSHADLAAALARWIPTDDDALHSLAPDQREPDQIDGRGEPPSAAQLFELPGRGVSSLQHSHGARSRRERRHSRT
jgi:PAS domain S-box-containing protein